MKHSWLPTLIALSLAGGCAATEAVCPATPLRPKAEVLSISKQVLVTRGIKPSEYKLHEARYNCFKDRPVWFVTYRKDPWCLHCEALILVGDRDSKAELVPSG
jgi:hypothetical protein